MPTSLAAVTRRIAQLGDEAFTFDLFISTRDELAVLAAEVRKPLLDMQYRAQRQQFATDFPGAEYEILIVDGENVGELIVDRGADGVRIVDVTVDRSHRGRGIASAVLTDVIDSAARVGLPVSLSVWSTNVGARRLYQRLGFVAVSDGYGYLEMRCDVSQERREA
jgi:ribosomal protein S18 acetylase RimI-like enzyme